MIFPARIIGIYVIIVCILLLFSSATKAAKLVTSDGVAVITSEVDVNEYRKRAIENALQNISSNQNIELNSFSLVENGKILIDQIQSISSSEILHFKVVKEKIKSNTFHVTVEALIKNKKSVNKDPALRPICRKTKFREIDLITKIHLDTQQFPVWLDFDVHWLKDKIVEVNSLNGIKIKPFQNEISEGEKLYNLYDQAEQDDNQNLYKIELDVSFEKKVKHTLILKKSIMLLKVYTRTIRDGELLSSQSNEFAFDIHNSSSDLTRLSTKKNSWQVQKEVILNKIHSELEETVNALKCAILDPKILLTNDKYTLNYGALDGLNKSDIFEVPVNGGDKIFFKVAKIGPHDTTVEPISERRNLDTLESKEVKVLSGINE